MAALLTDVSTRIDMSAVVAIRKKVSRFLSGTVRCPNSVFMSFFRQGRGRSALGNSAGQCRSAWHRPSFIATISTSESPWAGWQGAGRFRYFAHAERPELLPRSRRAIGGLSAAAPSRTSSKSKSCKGGHSRSATAAYTARCSRPPIVNPPQSGRFWGCTPFKNGRSSAKGPS